MSKIFLTRKGDEWLKMLRDAKLPCAPVNTLDRIVRDKQVLYRRMLVEVDHLTAGKMKVTGIPVKLSETPGDVRSPPPLLGQHNQEILRELGYTNRDIKNLREQGVT